MAKTSKNYCDACGKPLAIYQYSIFVGTTRTMFDSYSYCNNPLCKNFERGALHSYTKDDIINMFCLLHDKYMEVADYHDLFYDLARKEDIIEALHRDNKFLSEQADRKDAEVEELIKDYSKRVYDLKKQVDFLCDWLAS